MILPRILFPCSHFVMAKNLKSLLDDESTFKKSIYDHIKMNNPWFLQFNNSAIFESNRSGKFTELFLDLGMDSFKLFFTKLKL